MSDENIAPPATAEFSLAPKLDYFGSKTSIEFNGSCLKQDKLCIIM